MADEKKKINLSYLFDSGPSNYVEKIDDDGKVVSQSPTAKRVYNTKTTVAEIENASIGVDGDLAPKAAPVVEAPKAAPVVEAPIAPKGPYQPMSPQSQGPSAEVTTTTKQSSGEAVPSRDTGSAWERALIGATPLLVGMLTGNKLEGVQASGNYFATEEADRYKRGKDFNDKVEALKAKRDMASTTTAKNKFDEAEVYNPETNTTEIWSTLNGKRYEFLGQKAMDAKSAKPSYKNMVDSADNKTYTYEILPGQEPRKLGVAEAKFAPKYNDYDIVDASDKDGKKVEKVLYENGEYKLSIGNAPTKDSKYLSLEERIQLEKQKEL